MNTVTIYTTRWCPFCVRAKSLLNSKGVAFDEIPVDGNPGLRAEMAAMAGATSVPQIWIGDQHVGGCDELYGLERRQQLGFNASIRSTLNTKKGVTAMAEDQAAGAAQEEQVQQQFTMQRIYAKDVSFESPASPDIFRQNWQPNVNVDLNTRSSKADDTGNHEVVLTITVTARWKIRMLS